MSLFHSLFSINERLHSGKFFLMNLHKVGHFLGYRCLGLGFFSRRSGKPGFARSINRVASLPCRFVTNDRSIKSSAHRVGSSLHAAHRSLDRRYVCHRIWSSPYITRWNYLWSIVRVRLRCCAFLTKTRTARSSRFERLGNHIDIRSRTRCESNATRSFRRSVIYTRVQIAYAPLCRFSPPQIGSLRLIQFVSSVCRLLLLVFNERSGLVIFIFVELVRSVGMPRRSAGTASEKRKRLVPARQSVRLFVGTEAASFTATSREEARTFGPTFNDLDGGCQTQTWRKIQGPTNPFARRRRQQWTFRRSGSRGLSRDGLHGCAISTRR